MPGTDLRMSTVPPPSIVPIRSTSCLIFFWTSLILALRALSLLKSLPAESATASAVPGAVGTGLPRSTVRTLSARAVRTRFFLSTASTEAKRTRRAFCGIGARVQRSKAHVRPRSGAASRKAGAVASELRIQFVDQSGSVFDRIAFGARQLAQPDDLRRRRFHLPERLPISGERMGQDEGVPPVVLGSGGGEPVAEAVELLGVESEHRGAALQQGVDFRAVRLLDGGGGLAVGAVPKDPVGHPGQAVAAVGELPLAEDLAVRIDDGDLAGFGPASRCPRIFRIASLLSSVAEKGRPRRSPIPVLALKGADT